jgi:hypothetical protein
MYHLSTPHEKTLQSPIFFGFKEPSGETHTHTHIHTPFCFGFKEPDGETHTHSSDMQGIAGSNSCSRISRCPSSFYHQSCTYGTVQSLFKKQ